MIWLPFFIPIRTRKRTDEEQREFDKFLHYLGIGMSASFLGAVIICILVGFLATGRLIVPGMPPH